MKGITIAITLSLMVFSVPSRVCAQLAKGHPKFLGNIVKGSGVGPSDYSTYWNQVTPENIGKWGVAEPTRDQMNWAPVDAMFDYAQPKGYPVKHHAFVWGQQEPSWIGGLSAADQKAEVEEWIRLFGERYGDRVALIDVVNEPLHAPPSFKNAIGGDNGLYGTGWDWVIWTFEKARQYCPNAKLLLNDYDLLKSGANADNFVAIANLLKARGLIDGIAEQGHFLENTAKSTIQTNFNKLVATGLDVYISELDFSIADDNNQRNKYQDIFPVFWENPALKGVSLWGYKQGSMWRADGYLVRSDGTERPALTWLRNYVASKADPRLEAENYDGQQGITRVDGLIAYVDDNDWVKFDKVNFGAGYAGFTVRYAKGNTTSTRVEVRLASTSGTKIGEVALTGTGNWNTFVTKSVALTGGTGSQDVYFLFKGGTGVGNFDWFEFTRTSPSTTTANFSATGDAYVLRGEPDTNFNTDPFLRIKDSYTANNNDRTGYLKFNLSASGISASSVTSARLKLHCYLSEGNTTIQAFRTTDNYKNTTTPWNETGLTFNNAPAAGSLVQGVAVNGAGSYSWDVTSFVKDELNGDGTLSVILSQISNTLDIDNFFRSREHTVSSERPVLEITYTTGAAMRLASLNEEVVQREDENSADIKVYPNPAPGKQVVVEWYSNNEYVADFEVVDFTGKIVMRKKAPVTKGINRHELALPASASGMYLLNIQHGLRRVIKKIAVE